jgi:hypothetical protein
MKHSPDMEMMKAGMDGLSLTALGGWIIGALPAIATALSCIWFALRVIEQLKSLGWIGAEAPPPQDGPFDPTQ